MALPVPLRSSDSEAKHTFTQEVEIYFEMKSSKLVLRCHFVKLQQKTYTHIHTLRLNNRNSIVITVAISLVLAAAAAPHRFLKDSPFCFCA